MSTPDDIAIRVQGLRKAYRIYQKPMDMVLEMLTRRQRHREFLALDQVSFQVKRGEVVGVIGRNGAGKTTLLRIIAGNLEKTAGTLEVNGSVSAIMALGVGFDPKYSGRENIYMNGLCLGMTRSEIDAKLEGIIDFSGLREFIDQPLETYSSGMQARLAFSTATSVEPDILIIDEALSTGDMAFVAKCFQRIRLIARSGATVFFVTHSLQSIYDLCTRAILIESGKLLMEGEPREVGHAYEESVRAEIEAANRQAAAVLKERARAAAEAEGAAAPEPAEPEKPETTDNQAQAHPSRANLHRPEDGEVESVGGTEARILSVTIETPEGEQVTHLESGRQYAIVVTTVMYKAFPRVTIGFRLQRPEGTAVYGTSTSLQHIDLATQPGDRLEVVFPFECVLQQGPYFIGGGVAECLDDGADPDLYRMLHFYADALQFHVITANKFAGFVDLQSQATVRLHQPAAGNEAPA